MTFSVKQVYVAVVAIFLFAFSGSVALAGPLDDPSDLIATAVSSSGIDLAWTDNSVKEDGFEVKRSTDGSNFSLVATVGKNVEVYSDTGLSSNTLYYYRVRAYDEKKNSTNYSGYSNVDSDTTFDAAPAAPSALSASATDDDVALTWTDNADNEDGFEIERSTDGTNFSNIASVGANVTSYDDLNLDDGTYYYRVYAQNGVGNSAYSNTASETVVTVPAAPSSLSSFSYSTSSGTTTIYIVDLSWTDNADNEDNMVVERSTDGTNYSTYATLSANVTYFSDYGVFEGNTYYYRVKATNTAGSSGYSNVTSETI